MENAGNTGCFHRCKALNYLAVNSYKMAYATVDMGAGLKAALKRAARENAYSAGRRRSGFMQPKPARDVTLNFPWAFHLHIATLFILS